MHIFRQFLRMVLIHVPEESDLTQSRAVLWGLMRSCGVLRVSCGFVRSQGDFFDFMGSCGLLWGLEGFFGIPWGLVESRGSCGSMKK